MIMFQGFRAVQDTLSSLSEVLASPADGAEAGDNEDEAERGRDQGAGEGVQEGEVEGEEAGAGEEGEGSLSGDRGTVLDCLTRTPWYRAYTHQEEDSQEQVQVPGQVLYVEDQEAGEEYREGGYHPVAVGEVFQVNCYQQNDIYINRLIGEVVQ